MADTQLLIKNVKSQFEKVLENFQTQLKSVHTGRATTALVEDIKVDHYNSLMPLKQLASLATPSPQEIVIRPWDAGVLQPIETALKEAGRNFNPVNDGVVIRIILPPMSGEGRQEILRLIERQAEAAKVGLRNFREDAWRQIIQGERKGELTQDDRYRMEDDLNKLIRQYNDSIEGLAGQKIQTLST